MLKMLVLKMVKKYINIYKYKLSLFGRTTQNKQKALFSLWSLKWNDFQNNKKKMMLDIVRTYNNSNYKLTKFASCAR